MSRVGVFVGYRWLSFPRVSGDEPTAEEVKEAAQPFSPREQG